MSHRKTVYRDKLTNRLIPEKVAKRLDPSTWYEEHWGDADDLSNVQETRPGASHGEGGPAPEMRDQQDRHAAIVEFIHRHASHSSYIGGD